MFEELDSYYRKRDIHVGTRYLLLWLFCFSGISFAASASLTPVLCCDGQYIQTTVGGVSVWQTVSSSTTFYLYFKLPASFLPKGGMPIYVQVTYDDAGSGTLLMQYDSPAGAYTSAETHTRSTRLGTNQFVTAYDELASPDGLGRENGGSDFRLGITTTSGVPLSVSSVVVQTTPFPDAMFQLVLTKAWNGPYQGMTTVNAANNATLKGKIMAGYQGWFRCPNDLEDNGSWAHWVLATPPSLSNLAVDQWPDTSEYPASTLCPVPGLATASGQQAYVFSSNDPGVTARHFSWMAENNIDGAFVQRFLVNTFAIEGGPEWILANTRTAANQTGRIWAIEYDISNGSGNDATVQPRWMNDWKWLIDTFGLQSDPSYARVNGKPVIAIWGFGFTDSARSYLSVATANAMIDFLHNDPVYGGNYVILGIPNTWSREPAWQPTFKSADGLLVWQSQDLQADKTTFTSWGVDNYPHMYPGFSWHNLMKSATAAHTDRQGGQYYWTQLYNAAKVNNDRFFVGMFDEYSEGTAIMPMSDDPPPATPYGQWVTNAGVPKDWWMRLTAAAKVMFQPSGQPTPVMPTLASTYTPSINANGIVNAADFQAEPLSPGAWFTVFGKNLGDPGQWANTTSSTVGGASVTVCGILAVINYNSGPIAGSGTDTWQMNALMPDGVESQTLCSVVVTANGFSSQPVSVAIKPGIMELFTFSAGSNTLPIVTHADYSLVGPSSAGLMPASSGETVIAWGTGDCTTPTISVGSASASVVFSGRVEPGLCQINFTIPQGVSGAAELNLSSSMSAYILSVQGSN